MKNMIILAVLAWTFIGCGLAGAGFVGDESIKIAATPLATETPETLDTGHTLEQTLATIAGSWIANQHSGTDS
ncbi:MAG: hypothetical protein QGG64_17380 [Candidatus Latescibacteria bacterium]|nr:hypothetical protein [Candidatus Latescibacterota bacterium]